MIKLTDKVVRNDELPNRVIDGEVVIVTPEDSMMHGLNSIGTDIWKLLKRELSVKQIVEELLKDYDVTEKQLEKDVIEFLIELKRKKLIKVIK